MATEFVRALVTGKDHLERVLRDGVIIGMSNYRAQRDIPTNQCHNCQQIGHKKAACTNEVACLRCGGNHKHENCHLDASNTADLKCANCQGNHAACSRKCSALKSAARLQKGGFKPTTYAGAVSGSSPPTYAQKAAGVATTSTGNSVAPASEPRHQRPPQKQQPAASPTQEVTLATVLQLIEQTTKNLMDNLASIVESMVDKLFRKYFENHDTRNSNGESQVKSNGKSNSKRFRQLSDSSSEDEGDSTQLFNGTHFDQEDGEIMDMDVITTKPLSPSKDASLASDRKKKISPILKPPTLNAPSTSSAKQSQSLRHSDSASNMPRNSGSKGQSTEKAKPTKPGKRSTTQ
jgi:hypothetical protein